MREEALNGMFHTYRCMNFNLNISDMLNNNGTFHACSCMIGMYYIVCKWEGSDI